MTQDDIAKVREALQEAFESGADSAMAHGAVAYERGKLQFNQWVSFFLATLDKDTPAVSPSARELADRLAGDMEDCIAFDKGAFCGFNHKQAEDLIDSALREAYGNGYDSGVENERNRLGGIHKETQA